MHAWAEGAILFQRLFERRNGLKVYKKEMHGPTAQEPLQ